MLGLGTTINRGGFVSAAESLLLDTYSGAAAAYSLRKLSSSYSGPALQIRRASDNVEVDVSFDTNGVVSLDSPVTNVTEETSGSSQGSTTATNLGEFVADAGYTDADSLGSADSALVQCWYDQSSNSNDATQINASNQPKIYDGTTGMVTENGKPIINLVTGNSCTLLLSTALTNSTTHVFGVAELDSTNHKVMIGITNGSGVYISKNGDSNSASVGQSLYINGTSSSITTRDGLSDQFQNQTSFNSILDLSSANQTRIGMKNGGGDSYKMFNMQEIIFYESDQSSNRTNIEDNINTFYSIY